MLNYKILFSFMLSVFTLSIVAGVSYSQLSSVPNNLSSISLNSYNQSQTTLNSSTNHHIITNNNGNNNNQLPGYTQEIPSNNQQQSQLIKDNDTSHVNRLLQNPENNLDLPRIYKSIIPSLVEVTAYNSSNHTIFKTGSGFIFNYKQIPTIITVSNLVAGKNDITITLSNGISYHSNLTGYDPLTNLAILSVNNIPKNKLVPLQLGNSSNLEEGQQVLAIGNTMNLKNQITSGIISGLDQPIPVLSKLPTSFPKFTIGISTNLNLGNGYGGSPLLDTNGKVIGMNIGNYTLSDMISSTSNRSPSKNTEISFAVSSNTISNILPSLLNKGYYEHPWFGVSGTDINLDIAKTLNLNESRGFLVIDVAPSSPAKKAGIIGGDNTTSINGRKITLGGDIIIKIDNIYIQNIHDILSYIEGKKNIGDNIVLSVLRNGIVQFNTVNLSSNPNYLLQLNK